jgi:hypothetical protein
MADSKQTLRWDTCGDYTCRVAQTTLQFDMSAALVSLILSAGSLYIAASDGLLSKVVSAAAGPEGSGGC